MQRTWLPNPTWKTFSLASLYMVFKQWELPLWKSPTELPFLVSYGISHSFHPLCPVLFNFLYTPGYCFKVGPPFWKDARIGRFTEFFRLDCSNIFHTPRNLQLLAVRLGKVPLFLLSSENSPWLFWASSVNGSFRNWFAFFCFFSVKCRSWTCLTCPHLPVT